MTNRDALKRSIVRTIFCAAAATAIFVIAGTVFSEPASALPSFGRQVGVPCGSCHTDYPQLTPFGRRFKLGGYTMGGGEKSDAYKRTFGSSQWVPPISFVGTATWTHTKTSDPNNMDLSDMGFGPNNNAAFEGLIAYAGAITPNIGAFVEATYSGIEHKFMWEMADIRYANTTNLFGANVLFGVTAHNNPTLQDVWNSTPVWNFPFIGSDLAPHPAAATMIEGTFGFQVAGLGAYAWINDLVYVEVSGYKTLSPNTLKRLGVEPEGTSAINGVSPYWRFAVEPTWGNHSFQVGTFGMIANVVPQRMEGVGTDRITDIGIDSQYQYIADTYSITTRASFIWEKQNLDASQLAGFTTNSSNTLNSFRASATFVYGQNQRIALTGGYFNIYGSTDPIFYASSFNGSPNSSGWIAEIAYMPYGMNSPKLWPWFNARVGLQYTIYEKFNGASTNFDGLGRNASDNNTTLLYATFSM